MFLARDDLSLTVWRWMTVKSKCCFSRGNEASPRLECREP
jgi:hypothetical protein